MSRRTWVRWGGVCVVLMSMLTGCQRPHVVEPPDYNRALPPGASALRKITDPAEMPDFTQAFAHRSEQLEQALERSLRWFAIPSTQRYYPIQAITHQHAQASTHAFLDLLRSASSEADFSRRLQDEFDVYTSVGWNGEGTVLFTGYYTPVFEASTTPTAEFRYPLYRRPADLVTDPTTGKVLGRKVGNQTTVYPTREQIEATHLLDGLELVYLKDPLDCYIIQVQGSAKLTMPDRSSMLVGYAGNNGHPYVSVGQILVREGKIPADRLNLATLRAYFKQNPQELASYLKQNPRFVFFQQYTGAEWPAGSLGFAVTPLRSLATDKTMFPAGALTLVQTQAPNALGQVEPFDQFMVDQDTGGAIRAAGRADIYMGIGREAERRAGYQYAEGRLYYLLLKIPRVGHWVQMMRAAKPAPAAR